MIKGLIWNPSKRAPTRFIIVAKITISQQLWGNRSCKTGLQTYFTFHLRFWAFIRVYSLHIIVSIIRINFGFILRRSSIWELRMNIFLILLHIIGESLLFFSWFLWRKFPYKVYFIQGFYVNLEKWRILFYHQKYLFSS